jgi:hypothetical protein
MKKKYESLRLIAKFIYVVGYIFLFIGIIELLVLINGVNFLIELIGSSELNDLLIWIHGFTGLASIGILLSSIITYLIFTAISDIIKVFIDTEMNTAQLKSNSDKILLLLESKFGDKSVVVDSPPTIYSFLSEFGDNVESFLNRIIDKIKSQKKLKCPVCFGKGKISEKDIEILSLEFKGWKSDEACGFCRGIGKVTEHEHDAIWRDISNIYSAKLKGEEYFCVNDMTKEKDGNWQNF